MNKNIFIFAMIMMFGTGALFGTKVFTKTNENALAADSNIKIIVPVAVSNLASSSTTVFCSKELKNKIRDHEILVICEPMDETQNVNDSSLSIVSVSEFLKNSNQESKVVAVLDNHQKDWIILVANKKFTRKNPEVVLTTLSNYFYTLKKYKNSPDMLDDELSSRVPENDAKKEELKKLKQINSTLTSLKENNSLFSKSKVNVYDEMESSIVSNGIKRQIALVYNTTDKNYVMALHNKGLKNVKQPDESVAEFTEDSTIFYTKKEFEPTGDVGNSLGMTNPALKKLINQKLLDVHDSTDGNFKVIVKGAFIKGDKSLGRQRAQSLRDVLVKSFKVPENKVSVEELKQNPDNNTVEVVLLKPTY